MYYIHIYYIHRWRERKREEEIVSKFQSLSPKILIHIS